MTMRRATHRIRSVPTQDGAGVRIRRIGGEAAHKVLDPFLMIDEFRSDDAEDYIAGFPSHPHRGFETITVMNTRDEIEQATSDYNHGRLTA
jgi:redox-sensitive bicupin YhaK (pirin superfamily)